MTVMSHKQEECPVITEKTVQDALYFMCVQKKHQIVVPNTGIFHGHETDLSAITKTWLAHEFEIKISRSDWLKELSMNSESKEIKHNNLANVKQVIAERRSTYSESLIPPNYFWVVAPEGVVRDDLPDYAGHILVKPVQGSLKLCVSKQAPLLHRYKIPPKSLVAAARGLMYHYWDKRIEQ